MAPPVIRLAFLFVVFGGTVLGCRRENVTRSTEVHAPEPSRAQAPGPKAPAATVPLSRVPLTEDAVRSLVETWRSAQNAGAFDAYAALYAERFTGTKRVGHRESRFDRAGWLADRRRMFGGRMRVEASNLRVAVHGSTATATFTQDWSNGEFQDFGEKQLVVIATPAGARIAREDLLTSTVTRRGAAQSFLFRPVTFLVSAGTERIALVAKDPAAFLGAGPILHAAHGTPEYPAAVIAAKAMSEPHVYAERHGGKVVRAYGATVGARGELGACEVRLGEPRAVRLHVPHFGTVEEWKALAGDPAALHAAYWDAGEGGQFVGMTVSAVDCEARDLRWVTLGERAPREPLASMYPAEFERPGRSAFAAVSEVREAFERMGHPPPWPDDAMRVSVWGRGATRSYVAVTGEAGSGCADSISALVLFSPTLDPVATHLGSFAFSHLVDLDGDAAPELVGTVYSGEPAIGRIEAGRIIVEPLGIPYYDCDC